VDFCGRSLIEKRLDMQACFALRFFSEPARTERGENQRKRLELRKGTAFDSHAARCNERKPRHRAVESMPSFLTVLISCDNDCRVGKVQVAMG
jgi:hypothetical protein